ncbi:MAG: toll/interleukin-1 receptor domain-containing protein [Casimicrobiaceae bacterium]
MADIFISYARDDEATAKHLRDVLASQGWDIWRDKEGIVTGTAWGASIEQALREAKCVVVLWSQHALSSHFVRDEAEVGRNQNKLVPVQIANVELPIGFRGIQTANLVGWNGDVAHPEYRKLVSAIEDRLGAVHAHDESMIRRLALPWWRQALTRARAFMAHPRFPYFVGGAAVALIALWSVMHWWPGGDPRDALEQGLKSYLDQRYVEAESQLHIAAKKGNGLAAHYLAQMYMNGRGVKQDDAKAMEWALLGAKAGNANAQNDVGFLMSTGRGTKKDEEQALRWYLAAAEQGLAVAASNVAISYANGRGVRADPARAVDYYRRAFDLGYAPAANALGDLFRFGRGVSTDPALAAHWYRYGADMGEANASNNLGYFYANGQGGLQVDDRRAVELYRHAADLNYAAALNNLGYMYETGRGVPVDLNYAMSLYKKASDLGERTAVSNLSRVQERLRTPARR